MLWNMYNTLFFIDIEKHIILSYMQFISTFFSDKTVLYQIWNKKAVYFLFSFENYGLEKNSAFQNIENLCSIKQSNLLDFWLGNGRAINDDEKRTAIDTLFEYLKITLINDEFILDICRSSSKDALALFKWNVHDEPINWIPDSFKIPNKEL